MSVELVIFDADGVLFNSEESNVAYYNAIFRAIGEPALSPEEERACIFLSARQVFEMRAGNDQEKIRRMGEVGASLDFTPFFALMKPATDLRPFLSGLKKKYRLALATNRAATVPALLKYLDLEGIFDAVGCTLDSVRPKPAPDVLMVCLKATGVAPENAVYVGDSPIDQEAARAAGVKFLGLGERVESQLRVARLTDVPAALERFFP